KTSPAEARPLSPAATGRPLAAEGLTSYRYRGPFGWIMIGAKDEADALSEARRSLSSPETATAENLQVWDGARYVSSGKKATAGKKKLSEIGRPVDDAPRTKQAEPAIDAGADNKPQLV